MQSPLLARTLSPIERQDFKSTIEMTNKTRTYVFLGLQWGLEGLGRRPPTPYAFASAQKPGRPAVCGGRPRTLSIQRAYLPRAVTTALTSV